ncbi:MAG: AsmA family protein [Alphaproteobacteria bacterium]|nr:AsmA family protein [Alphaproteobacteria bacterium]
MGRLRRWLIIAGAVLLVALLTPAGLYVWASTRDLSRYQSQIVDQVRRATGRELAIKGQLRINFTLSPSAVAENVTLSNMEGGTRPEMARISRAILHLDPISLLLGEMRIGRIELIGADVLVERDANGRSNLEMTPPVEGSGPHPSEHRSLRLRTIAALPWINRIEARNSTLTLRETADRPTLVVAVERFTGTASASNTAFTMDFAGKINGGEPMTLAGRAGTFDGWMRGLPGELKLEGKFGTGAVSINGSATSKAVAINGLIEARSLAALAPLLGVPFPETAPVTLDFKLSNPRAVTKVEISKLRIGSSVAKGDLTLRHDRQNRPVLALNLAADKLELADLRAAPPQPLVTPPGVSPIVPPGTTVAPSASADPRVIPADPFPIEMIRRWNISISVKVTELLGMSVEVKDLSVALALSNGKLAFRPAATIGNGQAGIDVQIDVTPNTPVTTINATSSRVPLNEILTLLGVGTGFKDLAADIDLRLRGTGRSLREVMGVATGSLEFAASSGVITPDALPVFTTEWKKLLSFGDRDSGRINCVAGRADINSGVVNMRRFALDGPRVTAVGGGYLHMRNEQLEIVLWPEPRETALLHIAMPLRIKGNLARVSGENDLSANKLPPGVPPLARIPSLTAAATAAGRPAPGTAAGAAPPNACAKVAAQIEGLRPLMRLQLPQPPVIPVDRPTRPPRRPR